MQSEKNKFHPATYRFRQIHLRRHPVHIRILFYVLSFAILVVIVALFQSGFKSIFLDGPYGVFTAQEGLKLLAYALFTFLRLFVAYAVGLFFTLAILYLVHYFKYVESFLMPILDIMQSVPVLAFFPLMIIAFVNLHMPELAAQIVLFFTMIWAVVFGALGGYHQIPEDIFDAGKIYGATKLRFFSKIIFPAIFPSIITGSIIGWGAGWSIIIVSEYINYGNISISLPGLGSLLSTSAGRDNGQFIAALAVLIITITVINRLVWHKLSNYSEKFKFE